MRGLAITAIALHNFCHLMPGAVRENESDFHTENLERLAATDCGTWQGVSDIISFFGWYGVPIFIFLTGYGLVTKYERDRAPFAVAGFLRSNWLKLINLMIPGILAFIATTAAVSILTGHPGAIWSVRFLFQLTMLPDLVYTWYPPVPVVYWYFGVTLQFYVIYALAIYRRPAWWMAAMVVGSLALQWSVEQASWGLPWIRHNATGWLTVIVMGVLWGRHPSVRRLPAIAVAAVALPAFIASMFDPYTWQISILAVVVIAFLVAKFSLRIPVWRGMWIWLGRMSPFIFAAHPLVRHWIFSTVSRPVPSFWLIGGYFAAVILAAIAYRFVWRFTSHILNSHIGKH